MDEQNHEAPPQQPQVPPQNVNPAPPPQQYSYGKRNWIKWGLIYLIIAMLIYGGIYYLATQQKKSSPYSTNYPSPTISQPSPAPDLYAEETRSATANWKTYINPTYGFSLKYPEGWTAREENFLPTFYPPGVQPGMWNKTAYQMPGTDPNIEVSVLPKPFSESWAMDASKKVYLREFSRVTTADGVEGYYYFLGACAPVCPVLVDLPFDHGKKILQIALSSMGKDNIALFNENNKTNIQDASVEIFKKMIAAFRFTR